MTLNRRCDTHIGQLQKFGTMDSMTAKKAFDMGQFAEFLMEKMNGMEDRFDSIDERFDAIDKRFDAMDNRLEVIDRRLELLEEDVKALRYEVSAIHNRLDLLEERAASTAGFAKEIDELRARVADLEKRLDAEMKKEKGE